MLWFFAGVWLTFLTLLCVGQAVQIQKLRKAVAEAARLGGASARVHKDECARLTETMREQGLQIVRIGARFRTLAKFAEKYIDEAEGGESEGDPVGGGDRPSGRTVIRFLDGRDN